MRLVPVEAGDGWDRVVGLRGRVSLTKASWQRGMCLAQHISALRWVALHPQPSISESKSMSRHCPLRSDSSAGNCRSSNLLHQLLKHAQN